MSKKSKTDAKQLNNRDLLLPYAIPYFAYVGIASIGSRWLDDYWCYAFKIILVPLLLYWAWKWYSPITGPKGRAGSIFWGTVFGLIGLVIWCVLLAPFVDISGEPWQIPAFVLRAFAATLIVPVFEEMFIRGYILRAALQWDYNRKAKQNGSPLAKTLDHDNIGVIAPGEWSFMAILISSIAFAAGHMPVEWLAAMAYSLLISCLWILRKDLLSCIVAHGVTNFSLAIYVYRSGNWGFW